MDLYYVKKNPTSTLYKYASNKDVKTVLLWGDPVQVDPGASWTGSRVKVRARGMSGWIAKKDLRKASDSFKGLLEIYFIDVGQGDGVLIRTPDDNWHLVDAGVINSKQMTKKGAANFLRWKFYEDLRRKSIELYSLTATHPDADHYGGMVDLLSEKLYDGRTFKTSVDNFYHCGIGRFTGAKSNALGTTLSGKVASFPKGSHGIPLKGKFITQLLDDLDSFANPPRKLQTGFKKLADLISQKCNNAKRLSSADRYLHGYEPGNNDVAIHILGPVLEKFGNKKYGLRVLSPNRNWESKTRNGHSVIYRLDYGDARILMTGDLNSFSQQLLLSYKPNSAFACDVAKSCHHGSEDVDVDFFKAMKARVTVISSGDNESYAHPRPLVMGASGRYGRKSVSSEGEEMPPLIYSTELSRSVTLDSASYVKIDKKKPYKAARVQIKAKKKGSVYEPLTDTPICADLIYGLVNVRTDGKTILCATMKETGTSFDTKMFKAGV